MTSSAIPTDGDITLRMVLEHMQHGFQNLNRELADVRRDMADMQQEIKNSRREVRAEFSDLKDRWRWLDSHDLPPRISRLEDKVFAGVDS